MLAPPAACMRVEALYEIRWSLKLLLKVSEERTVTVRGCCDRQAGERLENHEPKGKGIHFGAQLTLYVLRCHVDECTEYALCLDVRRRWSTAVPHLSCETKVTDAANEPAVEQHVGRLDVAMDNLDVCVQVHQATCNVGQDDDALVGRESASTCLGLGESERQTQAKGEGKAQNAS